MWKVKDWMIDLVVIVDPDMLVSEALALMRRRYIHSLIVNRTPNSPQYGILTSTDVCDKVVAQDRNPSQLKVKEIMTSPLITVPPSMDLKECALTMRQHKIHHLPVIDEQGALIGMISATDFLVVAEAMGRPPGERIT